jgi:YD repeat-containing protein
VSKRILRSLASLFLVLICAAGSSLLVGQQGGRTTYVYDDNGRLIAVVLPSGDSATYEYDAAGNIKKVSRGPYTAVSIVEFTPRSGTEGTVVTIYGTGFSTDVNLNSVLFNGATAVVSSAAATQLTVTVPAAATTGPITITTTNGSATSAANFIVSEPPTITSFTPSIGAPEDPVTITGTQFLAATDGNEVKFNGTVAAVSEATETEISTTVPFGATSGRISVTTPGGTAESTGDFFVPPSPYTAADVDDTGRVVVGASRIVNITNAGHIALIVFDATAGQSVGVELSDQSLLAGSMTLFKPDGSTIDSVPLSQPFIDTLPLPDTGTYTLMIAADPESSGSVTVALNDTSEVGGTIIPDGPPVEVIITTPGRNSRLTFDGTAGQRIFLQATNISFTSFWGIYIFNPDGSQLVSNHIGGFMGEGGNDYLDTITLPVTGRYSILIDPQGSNVGDFTLNLYNVPPDIQASLTIDGPAFPLSIQFRGQNAQLTFSATDGQRVILQTTNSTLFGTTRLTGPDGEDVIFAHATDGFFETPSLASGTYTVFIDPSGPRTGSMNVAVLTRPADVTGTIVLGGPPVTKTTTLPGQDIRLTFSATAGQRASIKLTNLPPSNFGFHNVYLLKPDGSMSFGSFVENFQSMFFDGRDLDQTGDYVIVIDMAGATVGSATVTLYDASDLLGTITVDGPPVTTTFANPGQNAVLTFEGTQAQYLRLTIESSSIQNLLLAPIGFTVTKPDGSTLAVQRTTSTVYTLFPLPATGTYRIGVNPPGASTGFITLRLAQDAPATPIEVNGPPVTATLTGIGQRTRLSFEGTAGQRVSVLGTNSTIGFLQVILFNEAGAVVGSNNFGSNSIFIENRELQTDGTYYISVSSANGSSGSITLSVLDAPAEQTGTITLDGPPVTVTTTTPGENFRLTFSGQANQLVTVLFNFSSSFANSCHDLRVLGPDGFPIRASFPCFTNNAQMGFITLPASGTYTIVVDTSGPGVGTTTVTLLTAENGDT